MPRSLVLLVLALACLPTVAVEARTIRVDRECEQIAGSAFANDGYVQRDIVSVRETDQGREARPFAINFFGRVYNSLFINENGVISFGAPLSAAPRNIDDIFRAGVPVIVPFFADADMSLDASPVHHVFTFGVNMFINITSRPQGNGAGHNAMQVALWGSETSTDFRLELNYDTLLWESGDLDGGTNGLGGIPPRVGFSDGFGRVYEVAGSGVNGVLLGSVLDAPCLPGALNLVCNDYFFDFVGGVPYLNGVPMFPTQVPLPATWALLLVGIALLAAREPRFRVRVLSLRTMIVRVG